ncbi:CBS domain-containing protein [Actinoplanes sp. NPDC026670]|uniref:CBS domain-containing protein n=1 Tax=Actinoplanes sp. NPDC026670 TaxID=3154700 RepID=UPI0033D7CA71
MKIWLVNEVMTADVVAVGPEVPYRELIVLLAQHRINALPVVDEDRRVLGVVSESDLLLKIEFAGAGEPRWFEFRGRALRRKADAMTAGELMTAPAEVVRTTTGIRTAARRMEQAHVKQLPVVDFGGRLAGIVSRGDLLKEHLRTDAEILTDVRAAIHEITWTENTGHVVAAADRGAVTLTGRSERWSTTVLVERLVRQVAGVVSVDSRLTFDFNDRDLVKPASSYFGA